MQYSLKCGKSAVEFELPANWRASVLKHNEPPPRPLEEALISSLEKPIGEKPFGDWIRQFKNVLMIVPDVTRYAGMERILPILHEKYLRNVDLRIIFALGNHRKQTEEEQKNIVSESIFKQVTCIDHDCFDKDGLTFFGRTSSGLDVMLNSLLLNADAAIVTGSINFHYLAGFGGGRKALFPGVAGYDTIIGIHRKVFCQDRPGKHERAKSGTLEGNPMHEEIMEGISLIRMPLFLVNTVLNDKKEFLNIFSGDMKHAHEEGCKWYGSHFEVAVKEKADVAVVSAGGFPKDIDFIQAHKSIEHAMGAVKDGGTVIVLGECRDGVGNANFLPWFEYGASCDMEPHVRKSDKVYSQTAYATRLKAERCKIFFVSGLEESDVRKTGLIPKKTLREAIDAANDGREKLCYVIPNGSTTLIS
jgi:nickel-dependent lactate racemase